MRLIDRLHLYLESKSVTAYAFEKACGVGNGYLGKQSKGKGSVGSDILEKVAAHYPDLDLTWLITGRGSMLQKVKRDRSRHVQETELREGIAVYAIRNKLIEALKENLEILESSFPGKNKKVKKLPKPRNRPAG